MNLDKYLTDTAVLWAYSSTNGYGEAVFSAATEIDVRWEERYESFISTDGTNLTSKAIVHVNVDIDPNSFLYLGEIDDLSAEEIANPKLVETAYSVKAFRKVKDLYSKNTLRKVYLHGGDMNEGQGF